MAGALPFSRVGDCFFRMKSEKGPGVFVRKLIEDYFILVPEGKRLLRVVAVTNDNRLSKSIVRFLKTRKEKS